MSAVQGDDRVAERQLAPEVADEDLAEADDIMAKLEAFTEGSGRYFTAPGASGSTILIAVKPDSRNAVMLTLTPAA